MAFFVRFWGTRGSIPTPGHKTRTYGGNTSCVEIRIDDTVFICDGGTGLRELGLDLMSRYGSDLEAHMVFSHMHWDHIQGFPFFVPAYTPTTTLNVYEISKDDDRVQRLLLNQMRSEYFPVSFQDLGSNIRFSDLGGGETTIDGVKVSWFEQQHPGRSFAFSFEKNGTKVVYATDNEIDLTLRNKDLVERMPDEPRQIPKPLISFLAGADLLIADGQYTDEEYPAKVGWGHARATTVVDAALQSGSKQLAVFHHDPMHADELVDRKIALCRERAERNGSKLVVFGAREGIELKL